MSAAESPPRIRPVMSAAEVLNLIAFGEATTRDMTGRPALRRKWPCSVGGNAAQASLLTMFRMLDAGTTEWREADFSIPMREWAPAPSPQGMTVLQSEAEASLRRFDLTPQMGASLLAGEIERQEEEERAAERKYLAASNHLAEALVAKLLTIRATPALDSLAPPGMGEDVPAARFATAGLRILPTGEVTVGSRPLYFGATFIRAEALTVWPEREPALPAARTGFSGRPSSRYLVEAEMRARSERGEMLSTLAGEARYLIGWLRQHHPSEPPLKSKSVQEGLRPIYRALPSAWKSSA